jgi:putative hemolysin
MSLVIVLACTLSAAFFAGLETGLLSADQLELYLKKERGVYYARAAEFLLLRPERLLSTTLIGTNVSVVTAAILVAGTLRDRGLEGSSWLGSLALSLVLLVFTEVIPKSFFRRQANTVAVRLAPALVVFYFVFLPVSVVLNTVVRVMLVFAPPRQRQTKLPQSREDLRLLVRLGSREAGFDSAEHRVFEDIFDFRNTLAREVMIPLHEYPVCANTASLEDVARLAQEHGTRFLPVFQSRADNIIGYVDVERLLAVEPRRRARIKDLVTQAVFYPDVKRIPDLLLDMNRRKLDVAFLSDEYGAVSGLITPAEIAAEIVGFVPGKPYRPDDEVRTLGPGHYTVAGSLDIEDLYHETGIPLKKRNCDTVGGFVCEQLGEIPAVGTTFDHSGVQYRVLERDERHVTRIEILWKGQDAAKKKA